MMWHKSDIDSHLTGEMLFLQRSPDQWTSPLFIDLSQGIWSVKYPTPSQLQYKSQASATHTRIDLRSNIMQTRSYCCQAPPTLLNVHSPMVAPINRQPSTSHSLLNSTANSTVQVKTHVKVSLYFVHSYPHTPPPKERWSPPTVPPWMFTAMLLYLYFSDLVKDGSPFT